MGVHRNHGIDIEELSRKPASMAEIHGLTQITEGLEQEMSKMQRTLMTPEDVEHAVQRGIVAGISELMRDEATIKAFWKSGYDELSVQAQNNAKQWVGGRIIAGVSAAIFIALLVWSVKNGHIK